MSFYTPPAADTVRFKFTKPHTPQNAAALLFKFRQPFRVKSLVCLSKYNEADRRVSTAVGFSRGGLRYLKGTTSGNWEAGIRLSGVVGMAWEQVQRTGQLGFFPWASTEPCEHLLGLSWNPLTALNVHSSANWQDAEARNYLWGTKFTQLERLAALTTAKYGDLTLRSATLKGDWKNLHLVAQEKQVIKWDSSRVLWSGANRPNPYVPPTKPDFTKYTPPKADAVHFLFTCQVLDEVYEGRLNFNFTTRHVCPVNKVVKINGAKVMGISLQVVRLSDRLEVPCFRVSGNYDIESFAWSFDMDIPVESKLLLEPGPDGMPVVVEISLNGQKFHAMITRFKRKERFGSLSISCSGTSPSSLLASPYYPKGRFQLGVQQPVYTMEQFLSEVVTDSFHLQWLIVDSTYPARSLVFEAKTAMEVVGEMVRAVGGVALAVRDSNELRVAYRYPTSPWTWDRPEHPVDVTLMRSAMLDLSDDENVSAQYDHIVVLGSELFDKTATAGADVKIAGTGGTRVAPTVIDPYMSDIFQCRERGRYELSKSGRWWKCSYSVPFHPSLLDPGKIVKVQEADGSFWKGQLIGVSFDATYEAVTHNITLERYYGLTAG